MYIPAYFAETDLPKLQDFIEQNSFGVLISTLEGVPFATHLPFLVDRKTGNKGTLIGHMARANPHWKSLSNQKTLAVFSGAHAYISPTWYEADHVVPTWNYVAVHVYGRVQIIDDDAGLLEIVQSMVTHYEQTMPQPWMLGEANEYVDKMLAQIIGFRIEIETIEGKQKLSQNQPVERRKKVIQALQKQGGENAETIAELMTKMLPIASQTEN